MRSREDGNVGGSRHQTSWPDTVRSSNWKSLFVCQQSCLVCCYQKASIERALTKSPGDCPYIESLNKNFIIQAGQNCFVREKFFGTELVRRLTPCMVRNKFFRGSTIDCTPFQYKTFQLSKIEIQRDNGVPIAGTSIETTKNNRLSYNTNCALNFGKGGIGIEMSDFDGNHCSLVLDLTSSRETGKALFLIPELRGAGITLKLSFTEALTHPVDLFSVGERFSKLLTDTTCNISKNCLING